MHVKNEVFGREDLVYNTTVLNMLILELYINKHSFQTTNKLEARSNRSYTLPW